MHAVGPGVVHADTAKDAEAISIVLQVGSFWAVKSFPHAAMFVFVWRIATGIHWGYENEFTAHGDSPGGAQYAEP